MFRTITLGVSALAILAAPVAAVAQNGDYRDRDGSYQEGRGDGYQGQGDRRDDRDYRDRDDRRGDRDDRHGDWHHGDRDGRRDYAGGRDRDWRTFRNYDYNRPPRGQTYYADDYYRDGRYYQSRRLGPNDRIYRGRDNRYYCRRPDGTTGLVIGAIGGGVLGNVIAGGGSKTLGTILGATGGGLLGRSIDRNNVSCR